MRSGRAGSAGRQVAAVLRAAVALASALSGMTVLAQTDNVCDPGEAPDVIVGALTDVTYWGSVQGVAAYSVGTDSCNVGTCQLSWIPNTNEHPVIGQNLFRLRDGRFEQVGQSWLKHAFLALNGELCDTGCIDTDGTALGVNCSDPYWSGLNGNQTGLGPKFEVNAATGGYPFPPTGFGQTGNAVFKRLQVRHADLEPLLNAGATYVFEGQYVTADDAAAGNAANNASYRLASVSGEAGSYTLTPQGSTFRELPAIRHWVASDPTVRAAVIDVPGDGRFHLASRATKITLGYWQYEYAVQNLSSHRSARSFRVPLPSGVPLARVGFHDVDYHSGEPFAGTDWTASLTTEPGGGPALEWGTGDFVTDPNANALRWGTLYNFRFYTTVEPALGAVTLGLFRPGAPGAAQAFLWVPRPCNADGVCSAGESCADCPQDCLGQGGTPGACCGDGTCEGGESACACPADCGPCGETCSLPAECDDGSYCNGAETCVEGTCVPGPDPCAGAFCNEVTDACVECLVDADCPDASACDGVDECVGNVCVAEPFACDDGLFCNGLESCGGATCVPGPPPCVSGVCIEATDECVPCVTDEHCDDGLFCNGDETCEGNVCFPGADACGSEPCDEVLDFCPDCVVDDECADGIFCNGSERCVLGLCAPASGETCPGLCDEQTGECVGNVLPQPAPGMPLVQSSAGALERFAAGAAAFDRVLEAEDGLGPIYNGTSCSGCHAIAAGGGGPTTVTHFGLESGPTFDPLEELGGSLLQAQALSPGCAEVVPPEANRTAERLTPATLGLGLLELIPDAEIEARAIDPPPGVSGRAHVVPIPGSPGVTGVGRYGWKATDATLLGAVARAAVDQLGLTNRLAPDEHAPNGDAATLGACDAVPDPEDATDAGGSDAIDRASDRLRFLAPPPQTPRSGLPGEVHFGIAGCAKCHVGAMTTPDDLALDPGLRNRPVRLYSDLLLHDMGDAGDPLAEGDAIPGEVRTTPLWGIRMRERLWHDGRIAGGTFEERALAAIALHAAPGSEAAATASTFASLPATLRSAIVTFLASLGRLEFDHDGDGDLDAADWQGFAGCHGGTSYPAIHACAVHDTDRDGDVDDDDRALLLVSWPDAPAGAVPDGDGVAGTPLLARRTAEGQVELSWGASCLAADVDYAVYEGGMPSFASHEPVACSTGGATSVTVQAGAGDRYFLVVPVNGAREGSYGTGANGEPRPASADACLPPQPAACD